MKKIKKLTIIYPLYNNSNEIINNIKKNQYKLNLLEYDLYNCDIILIDYGSTDDSIKNIYNFINDNINSYTDYINNYKFLIKKTTYDKAINYCLNYTNNKIILLFNNDTLKLKLFKPKYNYRLCNFFTLVFNKVLLNNKIKHIALILDGNRRYSKNLELNKYNQHKYGFFKTLEIIEIIKKLNINHITLYAFSEENWKRDEYEIKSILGFLKLIERLYEMNKKINIGLFHNVKINILFTDKSKFNKDILDCIDNITNISNIGYNEFIVNICVSYGGQQEIKNAFINMYNDIINNNIDINNIDINNYLLTKESPNLDLMVRFGKVNRISNFLLYQVAYSEIHFIDKNLPEVDIYDVNHIIYRFMSSDRRYGK